MRTSIKYVLFFFALVALIGIGITLFSGDSEARTCVWDGGHASVQLASEATNWDSDLAPVEGDNILINSGSEAITWDISVQLGNFTIASGYTGIVTQSSDMRITSYTQNSVNSKFAGVTTKWIYLNGTGDFIISNGLINAYAINLKVESTNFINLSPYSNTFNKLWVIGSCNLKTSILLTSGFINNGTINIDNTKILSIYNDAILQTQINGLINGPDSIRFYSDKLSYDIPKINGVINTTLILSHYNFGTVSSNLKLIYDLTVNNIVIQSDHATYTLTFNINGHSLTATTITVGTRGILDCGNGTITCSALTSTSGTITEDTATWIFNDGAVVTATSGEKFYNVQMKGDCDFVNAVNVTNELRWIDVPTEYGALDVYLDSIYSQTIPTYTFGPEQTAAAEYSYLPDVQISMSQFYEDIDFSIYAYISTNLPVTYNITGTSSSWLSYHEGRIVGMPPDIGNYTYTITATHASGSVDVMNGYILVGSLSTAEYSYDQIWGLILWIVITAFMLIGLLLNIPLIQIVAFMGTIGSIVASLRIPEFEVFLMMFALGNSALFFIGMVRYRR